MGSDIGDLNNDGLVDLIVADMAFTSHFKSKVSMGDMTSKFIERDYYAPLQVMRNNVFINSGRERFMEAGFLTGLAASDWTWTVKIADFDNDGLQDVFYSNGTIISLLANYEGPKKKDFFRPEYTWEGYVGKEPTYEKNLVFRNKGGLQFEAMNDNWGLVEEDLSYAVAHADLDNDGDLDLIKGNLKEPVSIYRNNSTSGNILQVKLRGANSNSQGIGAEIRITSESGQQFRQHYPFSGFKTQNDSISHFGLGSNEMVKALTVLWPSGTTQVLKDIPANNLITIEESNTTTKTVLAPHKEPKYFSETPILKIEPPRRVL